MADMVHRMEKLTVIPPFHLPPIPGQYGLLLLFLISIVAIFSQPKRQRILSAIPVAADDGITKSTDLRAKFRHGSKAILQQGYQKVS